MPMPPTPTKCTRRVLPNMVPLKADATYDPALVRLHADATYDPVATCRPSWRPALAGPPLHQLERPIDDDLRRVWPREPSRRGGQTPAPLRVGRERQHAIGQHGTRQIALPQH